MLAIWNWGRDRTSAPGGPTIPLEIDTSNVALAKKIILVSTVVIILLAATVASYGAAATMIASSSGAASMIGGHALYTISYACGTSAFFSPYMALTEEKMFQDSEDNRYAMKKFLIGTCNLVVGFSILIGLSFGVYKGGLYLSSKVITWLTF